MDGAITAGGYQAICAALVALKHDPTKLSITGVRAGGNGWTHEGANTLTDTPVHLSLLLNVSPIPWSTGRTYPGEHPTLKGLLRLNKPDYWTFDGLNVTWPLGDPSAVSTAHMVKIHGGTGWIYQNSEIWGAESYACMLVGYTSQTGYPSGWVVRDNVIHDTITSNTPNQDHLLYVNTGYGPSAWSRTTSPSGRGDGCLAAKGTALTGS